MQSKATKSKYNPVILRQLRKDIYDLANSTQVSERIVATGFENLDDISKIKQFWWFADVQIFK